MKKNGEKLTLKVQFWHFLSVPHNLNLQKTTLGYIHFWPNLTSFGSPRSEQKHQADINSPVTYQITETCFLPK